MILNVYIFDPKEKDDYLIIKDSRNHRNFVSLSTYSIKTIKIVSFNIKLKKILTYNNYSYLIKHSHSSISLKLIIFKWRFCHFQIQNLIIHTFLKIF